MANRQMTKIVTPHQGHAIFELFIHVDGQGIIGHHLRHTGIAWVAAFGDYTFHQVAFGKNSYQLAVMQHGNGSDVALHHGPHSFKHGVA